MKGVGVCISAKSTMALIFSPRQRERERDREGERGDPAG